MVKEHRKMLRAKRKKRLEKVEKDLEGENSEIDDMTGLGERERENDDLAPGENRAAINQVMQEANRYINIADIDHASYSEYVRRVGTEHQLYEAALEILQNEFEKRVQFSVQIDLGFILRSISTGEYTLFYSGNNTAMWPNFQRVANSSDLRQVLYEIRNYNLEDMINHPRSGTVVSRIAYATIKIVRYEFHDFVCIMSD